MDIKKLLYIILAIIIIPITTFGQTDYFLTDSTISSGIKLINGNKKNNFRFCQVKDGGENVKYSPDEITEYGFKDGRVYISKKIKLSDSFQKVFLECLNKGKINLYYYNGDGLKTFFLEKDSTSLIEIPKHNRDNISYNNQLLDLTSDCSAIADATKVVSYNKKSLTKLIERYDDCKRRPFPHLRYGLTAGYELAKLIPTSNHEIGYTNFFDYKYDGGFSIGLFIDNPILVSDFSLHSELYYSKHGYSYNELVADRDIDFVANISSLKLPLLIRYTYPSNKFRPFLNIGAVFSYNFKNENLRYETTITENIIEINDIKESSLIDDIQLGYCIGGGIECKLDFKHSLFFEFRYNNQYGISDPKSIKISGYNFVTGINF